jgi:NADH-quinone oxidoreductase chain G
MEFLLSNHPLDCPICDQGGECDLQDQSLEFGSDRSRFREVKRGVEDKYLGPLIRTVMTRCIHCTRCVRFAGEICGVPTLGSTGRGNNMEIGTYITKALDSEISGNAIDLCPVGALTSKPYAMQARPWELSSTESIDVTDAVGAAIRIDTRGPEIMRVLPRLNEDVNEEWLSDKGRFSYDGLKRQRLDTPLLRRNGEFVPVEWIEALQATKAALARVDARDVHAVAGDLACAESITGLKDLLNALGSSNTRAAQAQASSLSADSRSSYLFNSTIAGIDEADLILIVGSNPRMEAPLIAARIRKSVRANLTPVSVIGPKCDLAFKHDHIGNSTAVLADIASGAHPLAAELKKAARPLIILGQGAFAAGVAASVQASLAQLRSSLPNLQSDAWRGVSVLHSAASRVAALDLGFVPGPSARDLATAKFVYLLNADDAGLQIPADAFVVYQGHHGDIGANRADVVLPGVAYTEKSATYINTEGRVQRTNPATGPLNKAREDWKILRALSEVLGRPLPYDTVEGVRGRMADIAPHFARVNAVESAPTLTVPAPCEAATGSSGAFDPLLENHWMTDPISRNSKVMAKCATQLPVSRNSYL